MEISVFVSASDVIGDVLIDMFVLLIDDDEKGKRRTGWCYL